jgi:hypothetical protein
MPTMILEMKIREKIIVKMAMQAQKIRQMNLDI